MPEKTENTSKMNEELRRQRNQARRRMAELPSPSDDFAWRGLGQEKRADASRRRNTYRKVIARVDKLLGPDPKHAEKKTPAAKPTKETPGGTPGEKLIGKHVRKAAGLKPLMTTLQAAAKQGLKKKEKNQN